MKELPLLGLNAQRDQSGTTITLEGGTTELRRWSWTAEYYSSSVLERGQADLGAYLWEGGQISAGVSVFWRGWHDTAISANPRKTVQLDSATVMLLVKYCWNLMLIETASQKKPTGGEREKGTPLPPLACGLLQRSHYHQSLIQSQLAKWNVIYSSSSSIYQSREGVGLVQKENSIKTGTWS